MTVWPSSSFSSTASTDLAEALESLASTLAGSAPEDLGRGLEQVLADGAGAAVNHRQLHGGGVCGGAERTPSTSTSM
jgi:hypothetical protein